MYKLLFQKELHLNVKCANTLVLLSLWISENEQKSRSILLDSVLHNTLIRLTAEAKIVARKSVKGV